MRAVPPRARVDGGGAQDPVGQAIATSRLLFPDGSASRVVLATADRFPDALAGSALAGDDAPILLTPTAGGLDPRVAEEITRVTGGKGVVLALGGQAALPEQTVAEARAAAGNRPCAAPLPASCRFAGTGREHTAALIADTVLAERGGGRVLLARGDQFADAVTAGAYAAEAGVPILLTPPDHLSAPTRDAITRHGITEVVVVGGGAAVSEAVAASVPAKQVRRVSGSDRTATAAAIASELWHAEERAGDGAIVVNVRDDNAWQSALTAAVASAIYDAPQLGVESPPAEPSAAVLSVARAFADVMAFGDAALVSEEQLHAVSDVAQRELLES